MYLLVGVGKRIRNFRNIKILNKKHNAHHLLMQKTIFTTMPQHLEQGLAQRKHAV